MIKSQIDVLNEDFSAKNSDKIKVPPYFQHLIGNPEIQFKLAARDLQGNATNGIVRVVQLLHHSQQIMQLNRQQLVVLTPGQLHNI
jgi:hypothetical protein